MDYVSSSLAMRDSKAFWDASRLAIATKQYEKDGVALIRNLVPEAWLRILSDVVDRAIQSPSPLALEKCSSSGRFLYDTFLWQSYDECRQFIFSSGVATIAKALMKSTDINLFFDHLIVKEPSTPARTAWHYEFPYWPIVGKKLCSAWIAIDSVSAKSGGLQFLRGSHLRVEQLRGCERHEECSPADIVAEVLRNRKQQPRGSILQWPLSAGDAVIFDARTVHGAHANQSSTLRRRAYVIRFAGDDVRYQWHTAAPVMLRNPELVDGAKLTSSLFPKLTL
jgi:ectoine hydroxylase-related dioxygenase (phytanoyl-CoA dioxygenase family)